MEMVTYFPARGGGLVRLTYDDVTEKFTDEIIKPSDAELARLFTRLENCKKEMVETG